MARTHRVGWCGWLLVCLLTIPLLAAEPGAIGPELERDLRQIDPAEHIEALSAYQSRFTGYPGCEDARRYIVGEFEELGLANVEESAFQLVVPIVPTDESWGKKIPEAERGPRPDHDGTLSVGETEVPLHCLLPNYARTPMTSEDGIAGPLVWGGGGYLADFNGKEVLGSIVLMEFNSQARWANAAKIGAKAIVFVEEEHPFRLDAEQKYMSTPIPIPRYYLRRSALPALAAAALGGSAQDRTVESALVALSRLGSGEAAGKEAAVTALVRWEEVDAVRISAEIPGTDPMLDDQTLVLFAYYDATSVVPSLCPGAESASSVATLLEIAEYLSKHPPRRKVKFVAAPGHYQALAGVRDYAFKTVYPRRKTEDDVAKEGTGESYFFIGLDLSSRHNSLGSFYKGHFYDQLTVGWDNKEVELQRAYSEYSGLLVEWVEQVNAEGAAADTLKYQSGIVPQQGRDWRSLVPVLVAFDSEVMSLSGYPAITLATTSDPRNSVGTPLDTFDRMEPYLDNVRRQAIASAHLVKKTADVPVLPIQRKEIWKNRKSASLFGHTIEISFLDYMPKVPVPNAIVAMSMLAPNLGSKAKSMMGVSTYDYRLSNIQGRFEVFGLVENENYLAHGFQLSPTSGQVSKLAQSLPVAATAREREKEWEERETDLRLNFFRGVSTTIFDLTDPLSLRTLWRTSAVRGESNSEFMKIGEWYPYLVSFVGQEAPIAVFFTQRDKNIKFLMAASAVGYEGLLLNFVEGGAEGEEDSARAREPTGIGYKATETENFIYLTALQIVKDMHELDGRRMEKLRSTGIYNRSVWDLHEEAGQHMQEAYDALAGLRYDEFYDHTNRAWGVENRVYPEVRDTATDVVKGVIFYFALLLPFVLFTERLLLNFVEIRRKIVAIFVLFVLSYLVLRLVHPAFKLSQTPVMILDGFFMLVAAVGTIWYLIGKFNIVMEHLRQKVDMIHRADVARASATMAAFVLGISNMRKRKVRTGLTAATLILLTFTILSFTSFETMPARMLEYSSPKHAPYEGVLLRSLGWGGLSERVADDMINFFRVRGLRVAPRSWFVNKKPTEELQIEIRRVDDRGDAIANAILGLSPEEAHFSNIDHEDYLQHEWFDRSMEGWPFVCIVPTRMKESLRIEDSDVGTAQISVMGQQLRVVGTFNSAEVIQYEDLDGEEITPVDFVAQQYRQGGAGGGGGGGGSLSASGDIDVADFVHKKSAKDEEESQYIHMEPDRVLVIPNELCLKLGGSIRAIPAGPGRTSAAESALRPFRRDLQDLLGRVDLALYAGYSDSPKPSAAVTQHRVATRSRLSMGGIKGLLVPILIAALIVFNTMLGAVYERIREIKTYASVGLAPMHIASLFLAESCVFAVMGAMVGYLFGQVLSRFLIYVPDLMAGISLNYSSVSAVWSALLVVVVVLASTAYPAHMAGKLSVPDETRRMIIAKPTTDVWEIWFPFTVSSKESLGVMSYLHDYFESNDEDAVGNFTSDDLQFYTEEVEGEERICLESDVWVAPLDMGVSQRVKIAAIPDAEEANITYLLFTITRKSGEFQTWHRMNLGFLKDLRKQLLIWRLVTAEAKKRLTEEGAELLEQTAAAV